MFYSVVGMKIGGIPRREVMLDGAKLASHVLGGFLVACIEATSVFC